MQVTPYDYLVQHRTNKSQQYQHLLGHLLCILKEKINNTLMQMYYKIDQQTLSLKLYIYTIAMGENISIKPYQVKNDHTLNLRGDFQN